MNARRVGTGFGFTLLPVVLLLPLSSSVCAKPEYRDGFFQGFRDNGYALEDYMLTVPSRPGGNKPDCLVCHWDPKGGGPRNPYGVRFKSAIEGVDDKDLSALGAAVWAIRAEDPDGDGHSTFTEVTDHLANGSQTYTNTPTFPGITPANVGSVKTSNLEPADIAFLESKLVPEGTEEDTSPPSLALTGPAGGETLVANVQTAITWTVSDPGAGVAGVDLYLSLDGGVTFAPLAYLIGADATAGARDWFPANRPSTQAVIQAFAIDNAGNSTSTVSALPFTIVSPTGGLVATTLRDFDMPGTQPLEARIQPIQDPATCAGCHGNYDPAVEPYHTWRGSMMAMASLDFMFEANLVIANQDAPESGDLCLRCHNSRGWLDGRSTPTDGSRMVPEDHVGVSCDLCHRMVDPVYDPGVDPVEDLDVFAFLESLPTEPTTGTFVVDPEGSRRGPFADATAAHPILVSPFHQSSTMCGTCHDVSNPVFVRPAGAVSGDEYAAAPLDEPATDLSSATLMPVERTFSEWEYSAFNSTNGVVRPEFAGTRPDGRVASCQDCHMRDVSGQGADPAQFPSVPVREDLPLHDMTGGSTWVPAVLAAERPGDVDGAAVSNGIERARYMLRNALDLEVFDEGARFRVRLINRTGHKLPTGYPEGRRMWINVRFYDAASNLVKEVGAYNPANGELDLADPELKIYETKPGIGTNLAAQILADDPSADIEPGPSFHFVLNNRVYFDNRIPPEGFTHAGYDTFGGAPVGYSYADGQYWDDTVYDIPVGTDRADVRVYFQSVSKEFVEFLRDENRTDTLGDEVFALWEAHDRAPPEVMADADWHSGFVLALVSGVVGEEVEIRFPSRIGTGYRIEYADALGPGPVEWMPFENAGELTADTESSAFTDDFTSATSGGLPAHARRFYRVRHD